MDLGMFSAQHQGIPDDQTANRHKTIVGILTFIRKINYRLSLFGDLIYLGPIFFFIYKQFKFYAQLR